MECLTNLTRRFLERGKEGRGEKGGGEKRGGERKEGGRERREGKGKREEGEKITCSQLLDLPLPFPFILLSPLPPLIPPPSPSPSPPSSLLPYLQDTQDGFQLVFPQLNGRTHLPQTVDCLKPERKTTRSRHLASAINKHMLTVFNGKRRNGSRRISNPQTAPDLSYHTSTLTPQLQPLALVCVTELLSTTRAVQAQARRKQN